MAAQLKARLQKNESVFGGPMAADEREAYASDIGLIERYVAEAPEMRVTLPTLTIEDHLTLHRGSRTIEIRYLGRGHTDKDIVVYLPKEGVLITGDLVVAPVPLIGDQSYVGDWAPTLEKLRALYPSVIVPGHGPVLRDDTYVKLMVELLTSIKQQVDAAAARGATLEETQKGVDLEPLRKRFTNDARELNLIFANYPAGAAVAEAYLEATGKR
jgi:glyoxylase-like metal-dependent hydrolase (beta-lactamase superfamily II)